jgi:hypothetical protein
MIGEIEAHRQHAKTCVIALLHIPFYEPPQELACLFDVFGLLRDCDDVTSGKRCRAAMLAWQEGNTVVQVRIIRFELLNNKRGL